MSTWAGQRETDCHNLFRWSTCVWISSWRCWWLLVWECDALLPVNLYHCTTPWVSQRAALQSSCTSSQGTYMWHTCIDIPVCVVYQITWPCNSWSWHRKGLNFIVYLCMLYNYMRTSSPTKYSLTLVLRVLSQNTSHNDWCHASSMCPLYHNHYVIILVIVNLVVSCYERVTSHCLWWWNGDIFYCEVQGKSLALGWF
jgi:hypothetical protein